MFRNLTVMAAAAALFIVAAPAPGWAGPGECPGFTSDDIDDKATELGLSSLAEADLDLLLCTDDPSAPFIEMRAEFVTGGVFHRFLARSGVSLMGGEFQAVIFFQPIGTLGGNFAVFSVADTHICRAEMLRSFTWRRLCAVKVDRSPN